MNVKYLAVAAALMGAASFTSCSNQEDAVAEIQTKTTCPKVIHVKVDGGTRAVMGEGNKPMWEVYTPSAYDGYNYTYESGDKLIVYSFNEEGDPIRAFYACTDAATGEFTLMEDYFEEWDDEYENVLGTYTWNDLYTHSESASGPVGPYIAVFYGYTYQYTYPTSLSMGEKLIDFDGIDIYTFDPSSPEKLGGAAMVGYTEDLSDCTMHNVMALLKITIPAENGVKFLAVGVNGSGFAKYSYETKTWGDYDVSSYNSDYDVQFGQYWCGDYGITNDMVEPINPGVYYIPVIPQTLTPTESAPFSIRIYYTDVCWDNVEHNWEPPTQDFYTTKDKTSSITLEAGKVYDLGTLGVDF